MANLFQNGQWAVTDWGMQSVQPGAPYEYNIEAHRLLERAGAGGGELYDWPVHMAEKSWIGMQDFEEAFRKALELHADSYKGDVDPDLLEASFRRGWEIERRR